MLRLNLLPNNKFSPKARSHWDELEEERLIGVWGIKNIRQIAEEFGRTPTAVIRKANNLGLHLRTLTEYESLRQAAKRCGYTIVQLKKILQLSNVRLFGSFCSPTKKNKHHRYMVSKSAVDAAVKFWCETEAVEQAARRLNTSCKTIKRILYLAIDNGNKKVPPPPQIRKGTWRIPSSVVDELYYNYKSIPYGERRRIIEQRKAS